MDQRKVENFFKDNGTPAEIEEVKAWFKTPEGQAFLEEKLDQDIQHLQDDRIRPMIPEIRSEKMWNVLEAGTRSPVNTKVIVNHKKNSNRTRSSYWQVAAAMVLLLVSATFYLWNQYPIPGREQKPATPITYATDSGQQLALILSDGTKIRLNGNTQIWIPQKFNRSTREVTLKGEAFFDVVHNEDKPFIVHTAHATIKDLGTAFNVRAMPQQQNVQVAVTEGKVSIWPDQLTQENAFELTQGQYGWLDLQNETLRIDAFNIQNYLSWMNGRLRFHSAPLHKVSMQLSRIYDVSFSYSTHSLKKLSVTADFERKSLEKVLQIIAMTLRIDYSMDNGKVTWMKGDHNSIKSKG